MRIFLLLIFLLSCGGSQLDNTKKLVGEGHGSLYKNGALMIPYTEVKLIPPGPDVYQVAGSLVGIKARDSLLLSLKNAASAVNLVKVGSQKTLKFSGKIYRQTKKIADEIHQTTLDDSVYIVSKSAKFPKELTVSSWDFSKKLNLQIKEFSVRHTRQLQEAGKQGRNNIILGGQLRADSWDEYCQKKGAQLSEEGEAYYQQQKKWGKEFDREMAHKAKESYLQIKQDAKEVDQQLVVQGNEVEKIGQEQADYLKEDRIKITREIKETFYQAGEGIKEGIQQGAKSVNVGSENFASTHLAFAQKQFIQGYLMVPKNAKRRLARLDDKSLDRFAKNYQRSKNFQEKSSDKMSYLISKTINEYGEKSKGSLERAKQEMQTNAKTYGYTLSSIKALSWVAKALFWDAVIEPMGKLGGAALGYTAVNGVLFPTMLIASETLATSQLAIEASWNVAKTSYDLVAPSVIASVASVFSILEYTGGKLLAGSLAATAQPAKLLVQGAGATTALVVKAESKAEEYSTRAGAKLIKGSAAVAGKGIVGAAAVIAPVSAGLQMGAGKAGHGYAEIEAPVGKVALKVSGKAVKLAGTGGANAIRGGAWVSGQLVKVSVSTGAAVEKGTLEYIGVPLLSVGIPVGGAITGAAVGTAGIAAGTSYLMAGETSAVGSYLFGTTLSGVTTAVGVSASAMAGSGVALYEVAKSIAVPSSYTLGSGIVLTYGSLVHLASHTVLAASDVSYLVLSLEGPRWVIYGVKGVLGKGDDLAGGTVLNLKEMQKDGEQFEYIPVSEQEMEKVIESVGTQEKELNANQ